VGEGEREGGREGEREGGREGEELGFSVTSSAKSVMARVRAETEREAMGLPVLVVKHEENIACPLHTDSQEEEEEEEERE